MYIAEAKQQYLAKHGFKAQPLKAVLFDMDGVLFDSMGAHSDCWSKIGPKFRLNVTKRDTYMHEGRTAASTINYFAERDWGRSATPEEIDHIYSEKCKAFNDYADAPPMSGALEVLQQIQKEGLKIFCVTGSGQASLLQKLHISYPHFFDLEHIVSGKDCQRGKPFPDPYLLALQRAEVAPNEAIVVENAPLGVQAAVAANIFTIAVNTGPLEDEILLHAGANLLYPSMQTLSHHWQEIFNVFR